ncbi:MAG: hypothetical protein WD040_07260 [Anaerolineales bacterium]
MDETGRMELSTHVKEHVTYPINRKDFLASCGNLSHVPGETREWVEKTLPDRTYQSAEEVFHALNMPHEH